VVQERRRQTRRGAAPSGTIICEGLAPTSYIYGGASRLARFWVVFK
jgi:hypothetical protein